MQREAPRHEGDTGRDDRAGRERLVDVVREVEE